MKKKPRTCKQCGQEYIGYGLQFCGCSCATTYKNLHNNPAQSLGARQKISASRQGKPTSTGIACPSQKRAKISKALMGRPTSRRPSKEQIAILIAAGTKALAKLHKTMIGDKHPMWRGGLAKSRQARYNEPEYRAFVLKVLERDNYTCQECGARNGNGHKIVLQVHHKIHYWERPDLAYDLDNATTLCNHCHHQSHKGMRKPKIPR